MSEITFRKSENIPSKTSNKVCNCIIATFMFAISFICTAKLLAEPTTPGDAKPCPCSSLYPGHYFTEQYYPFKPVLRTDMPLDILLGYIIMDSIISYGQLSYPTVASRDEFFAGLTCEGDTLNYALKHLYRITDYNPFLFHNFIWSVQAGKFSSITLLKRFYDQVKKVCGHQKFEVMEAEYILHLRTTKVEPLYYKNDIPGDTSKVFFVHNKVLDKIKGQVLPNFDRAITIFTQDSAGKSVLRSTDLNVPANTDFLYYYNPGWVQNSVDGKQSQSMWRIPMEEDKEYIVFTRHLENCIDSLNARKQYYDIKTTNLNLQGGIFPIVNGNVIDGANDWGWGTEVPLATFKRNLQELIDSIKNYGE